MPLLGTDLGTSSVKVSVQRYASVDSGADKSFGQGKSTLDQLRGYAAEHGEPATISGCPAGFAGAAERYQQRIIRQALGWLGFAVSLLAAEGDVELVCFGLPLTGGAVGGASRAAL